MVFVIQFLIFLFVEDTDAKYRSTWTILSDRVDKELLEKEKLAEEEEEPK